MTSARETAGEALAPETTPRPALAAERGLADVLKSIAADTATLVRKEAELARHELLEALTARLKAAGALAAAGLAAFFVVLFLAFAAAAALSEVMPAWGAWLVVAGAFLALALGAVAFAVARFKRPSLAPEETVRTVREDLEWARAQLRREGRNANG